jgi:hypothetical protein
VSLRLWRAPQPYFKLRFCSLVAFGPDCYHFPSAIANMRENSARSVSAVCEACRGQADVNVDACPTPLRSPRSASGSAAAAATGSASRPGRMAHGPTSGRATLSPATAVGAPTNGRDSSHLGGNSNHCRAQGPSWDSRSQSESTTNLVLVGSRSRLGRNQQAIGAKEQDESPDACAPKPSSA